MKVVNKSNREIVVEDLKIADNYFTRTIGLLGEKSLDTGKGLLITPCNSIHSLFMRFKFDAIFLDKNNTVKYLIQNMSSFRFSPIIFSAYSTLEVPAGTIEKNNIKLEDILEIVD